MCIESLARIRRTDLLSKEPVTFWSPTMYVGMEFAGDGLVMAYKGVVACFSVEDGSML